MRTMTFEDEITLLLKRCLIFRCKRNAFRCTVWTIFTPLRVVSMKFLKSPFRSTVFEIFRRQICRSQSYSQNYRCAKFILKQTSFQNFFATFILNKQKHFGSSVSYRERITPAYADQVKSKVKCLIIPQIV